jgi:hypothetical protein
MGGQKKNHFVSVRFSNEEKEQLKQLAAVHQKTLSEMVRAATLETIGLSRRRIIPEVNRRIYFELAKVSEQLERGGMDSGTLNSLQQLLNEIRRELVGIAP